MPIYDYRCGPCDRTFEVRQSIHEERVADCPVCGSRTRERLIVPPTFILKGSGFYATEYRSSGISGAGTAAKESSGEKTTSDSKSTNK